ncbi:hypothetical protein ACRAWG_16100 [Methylobacterium sp. P31]
MAGTRHDNRYAAEICREHSWTGGTCLVGDAGSGPTGFQITALSDKGDARQDHQPWLHDRRIPRCSGVAPLSPKLAARRLSLTDAL